MQREELLSIENAKAITMCICIYAKGLMLYSQSDRGVTWFPKELILTDHNISVTRACSCLLTGVFWIQAVSTSSISKEIKLNILFALRDFGIAGMTGYEVRVMSNSDILTCSMTTIVKLFVFLFLTVIWGEPDWDLFFFLKRLLWDFALFLQLETLTGRVAELQWHVRSPRVTQRSSERSRWWICANTNQMNEVGCHIISNLMPAGIFVFVKWNILFFLAYKRNQLIFFPVNS